MSKLDHVYTDFSSGELSPLLLGRIDTDKYKSGVKIMENFYLKPHGPAITRGGTQFVAEAKYHDKIARLIPFAVSVDDTFVLEFGNEYIRFYTDQGQLVEPSWSKIANPSSLPGSNAEGVAYNSDGSLCAVVFQTNPFVHIYNTSDWSKVADPSVLPTGAAYGVTFNHDGSLMAVAHAVSPYITIYNTSDWSKVTDPAILPTGTGSGVAFNPDGSLMIVTHAVFPYITIYNTSDWSKVVDPSVLPTGHGRGVVFTPDGDTFAIAHVASPFMTSYRKDGFGGWIKITDPGILPTGNANGASICITKNAELLLTIAHDISPYITIYEATLSSGFPQYITGWSKIANPSVLPTGTGSGVAFNYDSSLMAVAHAVSPFITIYNTIDWSKVTDPSTLPTGVGLEAAFNPSEDILSVSHQTTPFITNYTIGIPYEIATTYTEDELFDINFIQSADVLYLVHPDHAPATLSRNSTYSWVLADITFTAKPAEWIAANYPTVVVFHEERLLLAATPDEPQTIWGSKSAEYHNMTIGAGDADAFKYIIASDRVNTILWMSSSEILVIGTSGAEYKLAANSLNEAVTPTNVNIRRQTNYGSKGLRAIRLGDRVLMVQKGGKKVRNFIYKFETSSYVAEDLTILSEHITGGKGVSLIDIGFCNEPDNIYWGVRSDGELIGLTYEPDQGIIGWFRFVIAGTYTKVKSVACIDNATYPTHDDTWLLIERTINGSTVQYIEFIKPSLQEGEDIEESFYMDSGLSYNGNLTNSFSNLGHLEGETVRILADGGTHADKVVVGGNVILDRNATRVHIGLGYIPKLRVLTPEGGNQGGSAQGKIHRVSKVHILVHRSLNMLVGDDEFDRVFSGPGNMGESVPLVSDWVEIPFRGSYDKHSEIEIQQDQPLPLTVVSIMSELRVS